jgi:four helix bundle protein
MATSRFEIRDSRFDQNEAPRVAVTVYRKLDAWNVAMEMVDAIYGLTVKFPDIERFGLISQLQRSAVSVPANIAEGSGRSARGDLQQHLAIARGSLFEVQTLLEIAVRRDYITRQQVKAAWLLSDRVGKMLTKMLQSLKKAS